MNITSLQSCLSFLKRLASSTTTRPSLSVSSRGLPAGALVDLRVKVIASPSGTAPRTSYSSRRERPIRPLGDLAGSSHGAASISFWISFLHPLRMKFLQGWPSRVLLPPPCQTQSWQPFLPGQPRVSGWRSTDCTVPSPSGWMIGFSERVAAHNRVLPWCLSSQRCMRSWWICVWPLSRPEAARLTPPSSLPSMAGPPGVRRHSPGGESGRGALCPWNATTWRNHPRHPSKACKLTAALVAKAYNAVGQAVSALHAMAILQFHKAKTLKQIYKGNSDPELMQKFRMSTDFAFQAAKLTVQSLGKVMSTLVVQEHHIWLNLAEMKDDDKARFLDAPSPRLGCSATLSRALLRSSQQCRSCPGIMHRQPPLPHGLSLLISVGTLQHPPELFWCAESPPKLACRPSCRSAAPRASQSGPKSSRKSMKRPWRGQHGDVRVRSFSGDSEDSAAPSPGGGLGGEFCFSFCFCSAAGSRIPTFSKKEQFTFPPGFQVCGPTVCDVLPPHYRPWPILPVAKRARLGKQCF